MMERTISPERREQAPTDTAAPPFARIELSERVRALHKEVRSARPAVSAERAGPTAALRSVAGLPLHLARNGVNFNLKLDPWVVSDGPRRLRELIDGGFAAGCMQMQLNVLHPRILIEARDHPGRHPGLLVRVSGYSAYFDDLSPEIKQEIIDRTLHSSRDDEKVGGLRDPLARHTP